MALIPEPAFSTIMSYLHREYDYERQLVIDELTEKCRGLGPNVDEFLELVPQLLLPTVCMVWNVERCYLCDLVALHSGVI